MIKKVIRVNSEKNYSNADRVRKNNISISRGIAAKDKHFSVNRGVVDKKSLNVENRKPVIIKKDIKSVETKSSIVESKPITVSNTSISVKKEIVKDIKSQLPGKVVVTMTSWTKRIGNVLTVAKSIFANTVQPDIMYLNLSVEEFPKRENDLPKDLVHFSKSEPRFKIHWVDGPNTKYYKKVFPILKYLKNEDIIIYVDDDFLLDEKFIELRLFDFIKSKSPISSANIEQWHDLKYYGIGLHNSLITSCTGSVIQKKMLKNYELFLTNEIIQKIGDDHIYTTLLYLNGYKFKYCSDYGLRNHKNSRTIHFMENYNETNSSLLNKVYLNGTESFKLLFKYVKNITKSPFENSFGYFKSMNKIFLFMDRDDSSDDNAEHLCRYIMKHNKLIKCYFVLDKSKCGNHWDRLKNDGFNLIQYKSDEYKSIVKKTDVFISSQLFKTYEIETNKTTKPVVFLDHGVAEKNISKYLNTQPNLKLILCACKKEYEIFTNKNSKYIFNKNIYVKTGFPRFDKLLEINNPDKNILIQFTWRQGLSKNNDLFIKSNYLKKINSLLNNTELEKIHTEYGFTITFNLHRNMYKYKKYINVPNYIELVNQKTTSFQELFAKCSLLITDYSSTAFDVAYLNKPTIYYQFDKNNMEGGHTWELSDVYTYEKDGFGPVCLTEDEVIKNLNEFCSNNFFIKSDYYNNINDAFYYRDTKNCERVYNEIMKLL